MTEQGSDWQRFVATALGDGEGPRFDELCRMLAEEAESAELLDAVAAGTASVDEVVAHLVRSGVAVPGSPQVSSAGPGSGLGRGEGDGDSDDGDGGSGLTELIERPGSDEEPN